MYKSLVDFRYQCVDWDFDPTNIKRSTAFRLRFTLVVEY
jgi:hypothetical protein